MSADFWAGYISGAAGIVIGNPLDLVKVRLQALPSPSPPSSISTLHPSQCPPARHLFHDARTLLRGLPAPVLTYGALNALLFTTYNRSLLLLHPSSTTDSNPGLLTRDHPYWTDFTAGCIAGLATFVISAPTELIKCRAQVASSSSSNPTSQNPHSSWAITEQTYRTRGLLGFYHGGVITSLRDAVGYGFYFLSYEASKDIWDQLAPGQLGHGGGIGQDTAAKVLLCGGLAGVATWVSIFPLDVIKTRVQTQPDPVLTFLPPATGSSERSALLGCSATHHVKADADGGVRRLGAWAMAQQAYRSEGAGVFFRGMTVCCVRAFIVNAVQWSVYEWMMRCLSSQ